jgi:tRNA (guanosine-2'-O-)-methyltransferase
MVESGPAPRRAPTHAEDPRPPRVFRRAPPTPHPGARVISPERFHRIRRVLARRQPDLTVVMERVNKEHNFSAILRNCDAVGILEVHTVPPRHGTRLSDQTSAGAAKWIRVERHPTGIDAVRAVRDRGMQVVAAHPDHRAVDYREVDFARPTAILMGAELFGISDEALELADVTAVIPMAGMVRSLNVSVATSLLLYEAYRQREARGMYEGGEPRIPEPRYSRILFEWSYPRIARQLAEQGVPYPPLGPDGALPDDISSLLGPEGEMEAS